MIRRSISGYLTTTAAVLLSITILPLEALGAQWTAQDAAHEISSEAAQCVAYYTFAQKCAASADDTVLSNQLQHPIELAGNLQYFSGKKAGMSDEAMLAFLQISLKEETNLIGNSCANISVLILKYSESCKTLLEHPEARFQALLLGPPPPPH